MAQLTPEQRARLQALRAAEGKEAARALRQKMLERNANRAAAPTPPAAPVPGQLSPEQKAQIAAIKAAEGREAAQAARFQMRTDAGLTTNPANAPAAAAPPPAAPPPTAPPPAAPVPGQLSPEQKAQIAAIRAAEGREAAKAARFEMRTAAGLTTNPANAPAAAAPPPTAPPPAATSPAAPVPGRLSPEQRAQIAALRASEGEEAAKALRYELRTAAGLTTNPANAPAAATPDSNKLSPEERAQIAAVRAAQGEEAAKALRYELRTAAGLPTNPANAPAAAAPGAGADTTEKAPAMFGPRISKRMDQMFGLGQEMVDRFLPDISVLGTVDAARSADMQAALEQAMAGLGGLSAAENEALRARGYEELNRQFMGGQRALGRLQARSGVQGAAATAQFQDLMRQRGQQAAGLEQDIMLRNIAVQDQRRQAFQNLLRTAEQDELARQQFNIGQQANLLAGQQGLFFGGAGLANQLMEQQRQRRLQDQQMEAIRQGQMAQAQAYQNAYGQLMGMSGGGFGSPLDMGY